MFMISLSGALVTVLCRQPKSCAIDYQLENGRPNSHKQITSLVVTKANSTVAALLVVLSIRGSTMSRSVQTRTIRKWNPRRNMLDWDCDRSRWNSFDISGLPSRSKCSQIWSFLELINKNFNFSSISPIAFSTEIPSVLICVHTRRKCAHRELRPSYVLGVRTFQAVAIRF